MSLILETPSFFFYDLLSQSKKRHNIRTDEAVEAYLVTLLTALVSGCARLNSEDSLSLIYLQACQDQDEQGFRIVGDSCLLLLGFFPSQSKQASHGLYRDIGTNSFDAMAEQIYQRLARQFDRAVHLLLGAQILLKDTDRNVIPLYRGNDDRSY